MEKYTPESLNEATNVAKEKIEKGEEGGESELEELKMFVRDNLPELEALAKLNRAEKETENLNNLEKNVDIGSRPFRYSNSYPALIKALTGSDSEKAWKIREKLFNTKTSWRFDEYAKRAAEETTTLTLIGLDSDRAWKIREKMLKDKDISNFGGGKISTRSKSSEAVAGSIAGLDSDRAQEMRETLFNEMLNDIAQHPKYYLSVLLRGLESDRAYEMREKLLEKKDYSGYERKEDISRSLSGLDSDRAWDMREKMLEKGLDVSPSLIGLDSDRAWNMRERLYEKFPTTVAKSLSGLDSDQAWDMREKIYKILLGKEYFLNINSEKGNLAETTTTPIFDSFEGIDSEKARQFKEKLKNDPHYKTLERHIQQKGFGL